MADSEVGFWVVLAKQALDVMKAAKELIPVDRRPEMDRAIEQADQQLRRSDAALAQALGYPLCRCTFPPQVMLANGRDGYYCPGCKRDTGPQYAEVAPRDDRFDGFI
jgi:hypothetical protein